MIPSSGNAYLPCDPSALAGLYTTLPDPICLLTTETDESKSVRGDERPSCGDCMALRPGATWCSPSRCSLAAHRSSRYFRLDLALRLLENRTFPGGTVLLRYEAKHER